MRKIRLWIFRAAVWVAMKACVLGDTFDYLWAAYDVELGLEDYWYDDDYL
jgi:hypothetical protein